MLHDSEIPALFRGQLHSSLFCGQASLRLFSLLLACGSLSFSASAATLLQESFEPESGMMAGSITGQNGWSLSNGTAIVQSTVVQNGNQALEMSQATIMHDVSSSNSTLWIRFHARISEAPQNMPCETYPNISAAFFVGTNLNIIAYSNSIPVDLGVAMPTNTWTRFDLYCDYDLMVWNLSMDGTTIGADLPLCTSGTDVDTVMISSDDSSSSYIDQLDVLDHELATNAPDFDGDHIPDWWELRNFGGITAATASGTSSNSGMSFLETYIAGVDPFSHDPFVFTSPEAGQLVWESIPARRYDIQWAPNLTTNFISIGTVDWPDDHFSDATTNNAGFYRLRVSVQ